MQNYKSIQQLDTKKKRQKFIIKEGGYKKDCNSLEKNYINNKEIKECRAYIDTMALRVENENMIDKDILKEENKHYLRDYNKAINYQRSRIGAEDCYVVVKLHNLYRSDDGTEHYVRSYSSHKAMYGALLNEIGVKDHSKVDICRRDICIDFDFDYVENFKKSLYLFDLLTIGTEPNKRWFTTNLDTLEPNSIALKTSKMQISFYNKEQESSSRASYRTRYEVRFLARKGDNMEKTLKDLIEKFDNLAEKTEEVNNSMIDRLIKMYDKCKKRRSKMTLSQFVDTYDCFIYNDTILKALYKHSKLSGAYSQWLKKFKKSRDEDFILLSNREMVSRYGIAEDCKRALKEYMRA